MPKIILTRNAVEKSIKKWKEYLDENKEKEKKTMLEETLENINGEDYKNAVDNSITNYLRQRMLSHTNTLEKNKGLDTLKKDEETFHNLYDEVVSDFISKIFIAKDALDQVHADLNKLDEEDYEDYKEIYDKYEESYKETVKNFKDITQIEKMKADAMLVLFADSEEDNKEEYFEKFLNALDHDQENYYSNLEKNIKEEIELVKKEEEETIKIKEEIKEYREDIRKDFDVNMAKESLEFFNNNSSLILSSVDNIKNELKRYEVSEEAPETKVESSNIDNNNNHQELKSKANEKKAYYGAYLKLKENYNKKNWFIKIFSFKDRKAIKDLKEKITTKYGTTPNALDEISNNYLNNKENTKETDKSLDNNLREQLDNDLSERTNDNIKYEKVNDNSLELDNNKERDIQ